MRRIGEQALTFRFPAIVGGKLSYVGPKDLRGQWLVLSFVPALGDFERKLWNRQEHELAVLGAALLVVLPEDRTLQPAPVSCLGEIPFPIVGDPLGRLQRLFGDPSTQSPGRGRTFLIDPDGRLRFHLVHSLTERGMGMLNELLQVHQDIKITAVV